MYVQPLPSPAKRPDQPSGNDMLIHESETTAPCLCAYQNQTQTVQVIRIPDLPGQHFERVIFPGQRLMFYAPAPARLMVYTGSQAGALLADSLTCDRIQVSAS